jgi:multiple sugar transport system permease protein/putative aldouronate transport system permease protein
MKTLKKIWKHRAHVVMALPALVLLIVFDYVPMGGLILALMPFSIAFVHMIFSAL